ncbi:MAG TPA: flagellar basal-body MS-ring/collar protein FliF [Polyangiaceae bacterium]|jgi:flagellar M-ring protein FliF
MPDKARSFLKQLTDFWGSLSTPKRIALVFLTAAVLIAVLGLSVLGSADRYSTLYTELSTEDAAQIVEKLKAGQVPYRLQAGGTVIEVPEDRVAGLRLELAASGLPRGGSVGFEIFDRSRIGATEFEQQVNLRRAMEGELARSVMSVNGVKGARVHLVLPEHRLFAAREESASASVVVKLANSANFGRREVAAIVHLVSMAVPGLSKDRVSVISTEGLTLHRPNSDGGMLEGAEQGAEQARVVASGLETDAQAQLERVVGPGNADVRVNVELNPATRERTEELYEPSKTALRSEHKVEEVSGGGVEAGVAGVPGAKTNLPDATDGKEPTDTPPAGAGGGVRKSQTRNWEVQRITQKTNTPPGEVSRLSVAVVLNGRYENHGGHEVFVARSPEEVQTLEAIVKRAVGFNAERGDQLEVRAAQFAQLPVEEPRGVDRIEQVRRWLPLVAGALLVVLLLCAIIVVWRRGKAGVAAGRVPQISAVPSSAQLGASDPRSLLLEESGDVAGHVRARALELAAKDPATAAVILRRWLADPSSAPALPAE